MTDQPIRSHRDSHSYPPDQVPEPSAPKPASGPRARQFLLAFLGLVFCGIGAMAGGHVVLAQQGLLPAPPLAATWCIDEKFAAFREAPLEDRTLLAVGSSATWRNLDMAVLEQRFPGTRPYNAAPCYLHIDQTAFLAETLLERMPAVETVLTVVAPRDFESCPIEAREFFDTRLFNAYLDGVVPAWMPYVTGFRPLYLARTALELRNGREPAPEAVAEDRYGSSILRNPHHWRPEPVFDAACYAGLTALEEAAAAKGARLVVASLPVMPEWKARFDPEGKLIESWTRAMAAALREPSSILIDGRKLEWDDGRFADPVHVLYPHHTPFTDFIARAMGQSITLAGLEEG